MYKFDIQLRFLLKVIMRQCCLIKPLIHENEFQMQRPKLKYRIVIWSISNWNTACVTSVLGKSYEFCKTSQNNELAEETDVGFDRTTSSFRPEIFLDILRYVLILEKFC